MSGARIRAVGGLATDPSTLLDHESLRIAENVGLHRPGIIQLRMGIGDTTGVAARSVTRRPIQILPHEDQLLVQSKDGATYSIEKIGATTVLSSTAVPFGDYGVNGPEVNPRSAFFNARGSLYISTSTGLQKFAVGSATTLTRAGLPTTYQDSTIAMSADVGANSDRAAIGSGKCIAVRYVFKRTDVNGYTMRSAPSSRQVVRAPASLYANGIYITHNGIAGASLQLPDEIIAGDEIEFYRTRNASPDTADPGEDYYLSATYTITSADVTAGAMTGTVVDDVLDAQLGVALYASASQFGLESAKDIPPNAMTLAWWGHCAWAGAIQERRAMSVWLQQVVYQSGATVRLEGFGLCANRNGSYTGVAGNALTGVTFGAGLGWGSIAVGQWVTDGVAPGAASAGRIAQPAKITAFNSGAGTITLDVTPSGTGTFYCGDIVRVRTTDFYGYDTGNELLSARRFIIDQSSTDLGERCRKTAESLSRCISRAGARASLDVFAYKDSEGRAWATEIGGNGEILLITKHPEKTSLSLRCEARGGAWAPDATSTVNSVDASRAGAVAWSAPDEPEAWPPLNTMAVGDYREFVLAMVPLRQSLLVWKADGLYRITGFAPNSWQVDEVDTSIRLVHPSCTCVLENVCYAWTNIGIVAVSDLGVPQKIDGPVSASIAPYQFVVASNEMSPGFQMCAHRRLGLVLFGRADTAVDYNVSKEFFVYHARTGRWSKWTAPIGRCMAYDDDEECLIGSPSNDFSTLWSVVRERRSTTGLDEDLGTTYDLELLTLAATFYVDHVDFGTSVVIATSTGIVPKVGDTIYGDNGRRRVTGVATFGGSYIIYLSSGGLVGTTASWRQSIPARLSWHAQNLPGGGARWGEMHLHMHVSSGETPPDSIAVEIGGATEDSVASVTSGQLAIANTVVTHTVTTATFAVPITKLIRVGPPRNLVRATRLNPYVAINAASIFWKLEAIDLHITPTGRRIAR